MTVLANLENLYRFHYKNFFVFVKFIFIDYTSYNFFWHYLNWQVVSLIVAYFLIVKLLYWYNFLLFNLSKKVIMLLKYLQKSHVFFI